jgi:hypothetical protein
LGARANFNENDCNNSLADPWALKCPFSLCAQNISTQVVNENITETVARQPFYNDSYIDTNFTWGDDKAVFQTSPLLTISFGALVGLQDWFPIRPSDATFANTAIGFNGATELIRRICEVVNGSVTE